MQAHEPPRSLIEDPMAMLGFDFLQKLGSENRLIVHLILAPHGGCEDFQDIVRDFGDILSESPIIGAEISWNSHTTIDQLPEFSKADYLLASSGWLKEFQDEEFAWLKGQEKIILPCEFPDDRLSEFYQSYQASLRKFWDLYKRKENKEINRIASILYGSYQTVRQWTFVSQFGYWLYHLDKTDGLPLGKLELPLILGANHVSMGGKFADFGILSRSHVFQNDKRTLGLIDTKDTAIFSDVTAYARITHEQLDADVLIDWE